MNHGRKSSGRVSKEVKELTGLTAGHDDVCGAVVPPSEPGNRLSVESPAKKKKKKSSGRQRGIP